MKRLFTTFLLFAALVCLGTEAANAQGVTTAAISGRVTGPDGQGLPNMQVRVLNTATGVSRGALTNATGHFIVAGLQVGGPYTVDVTGIGYAATSRSDIRLTLGQNLNLDFRMEVQAVEVEGVTATADRTAAEIINPNRTGAEQLVTEHQLQNLPTITRNFTDFIQLSPLVGAGGGATSVGQQNNRFNSIQIDGAITQDMFGLGSTGQPGGQAGARSITIEAVKEYQVLAAPFDVRQSGFSGGLINAVTKSGTNQFKASAYTYFKNKSLVRGDLITESGDTLGWGKFTNTLYGGTLGGPVVRDKVHFFVAGEFEHDERPASGVAIGREAPAVTHVAEADAARFAQLMSTRSVEPGSPGSQDIGNPNRNLFARIDASLSDQHLLTLRHNWVSADDEVVTNRSGGSFYSFDSNWYAFTTRTNSSVAQLNSTFGGSFFNELTAGYTRIRDRRAPNVTYPVVQVRVPDADGSGTATLVAGAEYFSQGNELDQDILELTNNLSFTAGNHRITVGVHGERFKFRNLFQPGKTGEWTFNTLDALEAGTPSAYRRSVPVQGIDPNARFAVTQLGVYAQTAWTPQENLTITAGLRYDVPILGDKPVENALVLSTYGRSTADVPSGNGIFSPRLGFNWDVNGDRSTQLRGGAGIFTGRHPYVWLSNLYTNTGLATVTISCNASNIPAFTLDPSAQPETCANTGTPAPPRAVINLMDEDFKYPHSLRMNAAVDKRLPYGIVGTAEFMYTKAIKQVFLRELNLNLTPVNTTQGGRPMFGTIRTGIATGSNTTLATPNRISTATDAVVEVTNSDRDRSWSGTLQLQKRYSNSLDLNVSYTHSDAKDVSGLTSSIATSNIGFNPVTGSPNNPPLATSDYETPHKLVISGSYDPTPWLRVSMFYVGASGDGYSYVYDGDVNADGYEAAYASNRFNDLLYVPLNQNDISLVDPADWTDLSAFIESEECLRENKGKILERNACREPWQNRLDARLTFTVPTMRGQRAEVFFDVFNVLNLLNQDWGQVRGIPNPTADLLELRGWDAANNRGYFEPTGNMNLGADGKADPFTTFSSASRYQLQLGVKYTM